MRRPFYRASPCGFWVFGVLLKPPYSGRGWAVIWACIWRNLPNMAWRRTIISWLWSLCRIIYSSIFLPKPGCLAWCWLWGRLYGWHGAFSRRMKIAGWLPRLFFPSVCIRKLNILMLRRARIIGCLPWLWFSGWRSNPALFLSRIGFILRQGNCDIRLWAGFQRRVFWAFGLASRWWWMCAKRHWHITAPCKNRFMLFWMTAPMRLNCSTRF